MQTPQQKRSAEIRQQRKTGKHGFRMTGCLSRETIDFQRKATVNFLRSFN